MRSFVRKHDWTWAIPFVLFTLVTVYWPIVSEPRTPKFISSVDTWWLLGPNLYFFDYCLHRGELPPWNPLTFCGTPFAANPETLVFYPPNILRSLLTIHPTPLKTHVGLAFMVLLHQSFAGVGMIFLTRSHRLSRSANAVTVQVGPLSAQELLLYVSPNYPGWSATVNVTPVPILRADDTFL